jgi:hypothetical protein
METRAERRVPLIVVAHQETAALVEWLRAEGAVVYQTRTPEGCLRVATAVRPDMIVLPRGFPCRLVRLLQQHPTSADARIVWFQRPATGDAVLLADDSVAIEGELARSADNGSDPPRHAAARQVTGQDLARRAGQLAGECLERSGPAHA